MKRTPCSAQKAPGNNVGMHLDHLSFAAGPEGLEATAQRLGAQLGVTFLDGGFHPRFGTRNWILPLTDGQYLEVVGVLDHPAADKAPFGQAVRARSAQGGGWLGWVIAVDDLAPIEQRMGRPAIEGHRHLPDGTVLTWHQLGSQGSSGRSAASLLRPVVARRDPSLGRAAARSSSSRSRSPVIQRVSMQWLGGRSKEILADVDIGWCRPRDRTGLAAAIFSTPRGEVRI